MKAASSRLMDPYKAASQELEFDLSIMPDAELPRFAKAVERAEEVKVLLRFFWDQQRRCRVEGKLETRAGLRCERCLEIYEVTLQPQVDACVVWSEEQATNLSSELDPWLGDNERIDLARMIEDELLLAIPLMPVHEINECQGRSSWSTAGPEETEERHNPFADLASLMNKVKK